MKKVVFDASPLIFIAKADMLGLVERVYRKVYLSSYILAEIRRPLELGYSAPEIDKIEKAKIVKIVDISVKEIMEAKKIANDNNIGMGEAQAIVLFKSGMYENVVVADIRAQRKMKALKVDALDLVDLGFLVAKRGFMNPRQFAKNLYEKAHYRTQRIRDILGK